MGSDTINATNTYYVQEQCSIWYTAVLVLWFCSVDDEIRNLPINYPPVQAAEATLDVRVAYIPGTAVQYLAYSKYSSYGLVLEMSKICNSLNYPPVQAAEATLDVPVTYTVTPLK